MTERYTLKAEEDSVALWDEQEGEAVSVAVAKNRLNRGERTTRAAEAVLEKLDYLQSLWGKEGVTNRLAEQLRSALKREDVR